MNKEQVDSLIAAIRIISHGPTEFPAGLELVAIALGGQGKGESVAAGLNRIADEISDLADVIRERG